MADKPWIAEGITHFEYVKRTLAKRGDLLDSWTSYVGGPAETPRELGVVIRRGWTLDKDEKGELCLTEHREIVGAIVECPDCGKEVECLSDTDGWRQFADNSNLWHHDSYGPPMGECCDMLLAESALGGPMHAYVPRAGASAAGPTRPASEGRDG